MTSQQNPKVKRYGTMADFDSLHSDRICKHYIHAKEKHPCFCDWIGPTNKSPCDVERVKKQLAISHRCIKRNMKLGRLGWDDILDCEVWEVFDALVRGDKVQAVEELYDCIAVCLRAIDVIEGSQKLGRPETKGVAE